MLDHATSETGIGSRLGIDATILSYRTPVEGFKHPWSPLIKMEGAMKAKVKRLFNL